MDKSFHIHLKLVSPFLLHDLHHPHMSVFIKLWYPRPVQLNIGPKPRQASITGRGHATLPTMEERAWKGL